MIVIMINVAQRWRREVIEERCGVYVKDFLSDSSSLYIPTYLLVYLSIRQKRNRIWSVLFEQISVL